MGREPQPSIDDYDNAWPLRFGDLAATIREVLGSIVVRIEHVGSTAVPGLAAKPIIDLDVVVRSADEVQLAILRLAQIGYVHEGELGIAGRAAFRSPPGQAQHHLYVLREGAQELQRHLAFRDALRADAALRDAYCKLKRSLAIQHAGDRAAYTDGKTDFVRAALASPMTSD
jgi:GrpB-like predicted nucleotidyltransferase (UPF0157 family)